MPLTPLATVAAAGGARESPAEIGSEARPICWLTRLLAAIDDARGDQQAKQRQRDPANRRGHPHAGLSSHSSK